MTPNDMLTILQAAKRGAKNLENLTTDDFSKGGDKPAREAFEQIIATIEAAVPASA